MAVAVDFLYEQAARRAMGASHDYETARATFSHVDAPGPSPAPREPSRSEDVLAEFERRLAAYQLNSQHPRNFGYFTPPPLLMSIAGEVLAQVTNQGVDVWHAGPTGAFVEEEVVRWLADLVGYGPDSFGLLTSGGVMANFMAMALARDIHLPKVCGLDRPPRGRDLEGVRVYASDQTHFSIARALDELGFPQDTLVVIAADELFRLRGEPVAEAIAGTGPPGSHRSQSQPSRGPRTPARWTRSPSLRMWPSRRTCGACRRGVRRGSPPLREAGEPGPRPAPGALGDRGSAQVVLPGVRHRRAAGPRRQPPRADVRRPAPEYYRDAEGQVAGRDDDHDEDAGQLSFYKLGFEGTRRWRALKLWLSWKHLGTEGLARLVETTVDLAAHLSGRCAEADDFETLPQEAELSVVCFRHLPGGLEAALQLPPGELDAHQDRLQAALEASGDGWLTTTRLRGATYLRAGIVNYLATEADIDRLLDTLRRLAGAR